MSLSTLTQLFDPRQLALDPASLITYEVDAGYDRGRPDGVFFPESIEDVVRLVQWAGRARVPLIARGAGTGLSGGAVAEHGGLILSFARMNRVVELDAAGRSAVVQAGMVNLALDALVKEAGLYYPPDPSSGRSSVIGGNIGENAGGPHCFKYGVTTNYVTGLEVVLADGQAVHLGGRALDYPEYDFCGLVVGSEGTLAVVVQADVRLIRNPPGVKTMMVAFDSEEQAGHAVSAVIAAGLAPATLEMMDQRIMRIIEAYVPVGLPVNRQAALIVEVDGYPAGLDSQMEEIADILTAHGGSELRIAESEDERQQIWYGRKSAAGALSRLAPNFYLVDITVPRSRLADTLAAVNAIADRYRLTLGHVFHAGDGNLHPCISFDARDEDERERVFAACAEIVRACVERDGSITGEHGVGIEKRAYMPMMYSGAELAAMTEIKALFDPHGLLNPGKIFPAELPAADYAQPGALPSGDTFTPTSAAEAASGLAALAAAGKTVRIGGAAGGDRRGADFWLSTAAFNGVSVFAPDDLYVTAGAGTPLAELQAFLAERGMQAPLVSPWPAATIGGLVAANVNSPQRLRYGGLRDLLLATTVALADGRVIRAGRPVVKNVAGYDLAKLLIGSYGTLGVLADVTLKLLPRPRSRRTFALAVDDPAQGLGWAAATAPVWLATAGVVLCQGLALPGVRAAPYTLVWTVEGLAEDVAAEWEALQAALQTAGAPTPLETAPAPSAADLWADCIGAAGPADLVVRVGVPPGRLLDYWRQLPAPVREAARWCLDGGNYLAYAIYRGGDGAAAAAWLDGVRGPALARGGYAIAIQTPAAWQTELDPWGYRPAAYRLMRALRARWDPAGVLNPGDFI
ncbi:MAG TPA: FAD-linked oxidase C-terminal domain-containing protein [Caldilineaceae bacterium]|nr:FAD-linked oxidase C-terminal domain-containing protein [Caldilineaceae bacterium]